MVSPSLSNESMPGQYYLFVYDADRMVKQAVEHGATLVMDVKDQPFGDRQGGVKDMEGNIWWISKRLKQEPYSLLSHLRWVSEQRSKK